MWTLEYTLLFAFIVGGFCYLIGYFRGHAVATGEALVVLDRIGRKADAIEASRARPNRKGACDVV